MNTMEDDRLTRVEERLAHQEQTIAELSDVLHRQQGELDRLEALCTQLGERLLATNQDAVSDPLDEKPPHY